MVYLYILNFKIYIYIFEVLSLRKVIRKQSKLINEPWYQEEHTLQ